MRVGGGAHRGIGSGRGDSWSGTRWHWYWEGWGRGKGEGWVDTVNVAEGRGGREWGLEGNSGKKGKILGKVIDSQRKKILVNATKLLVLVTLSLRKHKRLLQNFRKKLKLFCLAARWERGKTTEHEYKSHESWVAGVPIGRVLTSLCCSMSFFSGLYEGVRVLGSCQS